MFYEQHTETKIYSFLYRIDACFFHFHVLFFQSLAFDRILPLSDEIVSCLSFTFVEMKARLVLLIFLLFTPLFLQAKERPYFIRLGVEEGLAQNTVYCILQDKQGFMWFGTKDGLCRYDGRHFRTFRHDKEDKNSIGNNFIRSLYQDNEDEIWIGTDAGVYVYYPREDVFRPLTVQTKDGIRMEKEVNDIKRDKQGVFWFAVDWQGVFSYDPRSRELVFYELNAIVNAWSICIDREDRIWIGTHGGGLNLFNSKEKKFETISLSDQNGIQQRDDIYRIYQDNYNDLLIATGNSGVKKLRLTDNKVESLLPEGDQSSLFVRDIIRRSDHEIWFGTGAGVLVYNTTKGSFYALLHNHQDPYSLSDNAVYSMYQDREGGIWVGTYFGGLNYYPPQHATFDKYYPLNESNSLRSKRIREFQSGRDGSIWIGSEDEGLSLYHPDTDTFENFFPGSGKGAISYNNIHGLMLDGDHLWIGTFSRGIDIMDVRTKRVIKHYNKTNDISSLCDNSVFAIYKDHSNRIWVGTLYGLCYYNPEGDNFTWVIPLGNMFIYDILQTSDGMIWFASLGGGLHRFNPRSKEWTAFTNDPSDDGSLPHNKVISLFEDTRKNLWLTTEGGGIARYNPVEQTFLSLTTKEGLPNDMVYKILEDDNLNLWFTTNKGIACMDPNTYAIRNYTRSDGLLSNQFNYKSGFKDESGRLYFGGLTGFVAFNPSTFTQNKHVPPVCITSFELFNEPMKTGRKDSPLQEAIEYASSIELKHNQSTFSFRFAALSYTAPEKNQYAYMLQGFDKDWMYLPTNQKVSYSNLPSGEYTFLVKASNNDGVWNEEPARLRISIYPPFYKTFWAYLFYVLVAAATIAYSFVSYRNRAHRKNKRRLEIFENKKSKELYDAKIAFFTNIAHEIRTPLTLIKGPLEHILQEPADPKEYKDDLEVIERNTNRLLDLSNQLLDFRKTEKEGFRLNYVTTELVQLISDVCIRFKPTIVQRNLKMEQDIRVETFYADVDQEAVIKIVSNLLSNAIKYAQKSIRLQLQPDEAFFEICVVNDGKVIAPHLREKIFEPFYQIEDNEANQIRSGTGLGLPLARSLAELHQGQLLLQVGGDGFNCFVLRLPVRQQTALSLPKDQVIPEKKEANLLPSIPGVDLQPSLLVVEDDGEMQTFIVNKLKKTYRVWRAFNGKEALELLDKEKIDIVVTDVMMPVMDGLQLCSEIKSNLHYSHIPVIMLTAKTGLQAKIEGLEVGADAYVEKPFSTEHLLVQISNLLSNRNTVKESFARSPYIKTGSIALTKADEDFLAKVTEVIHKNMADVQFNVDFLADALSMSRSSLHRKIKGISELTPNDFILLVRLKKAAEYLQEGLYRINEVCFVVGFSSSSYFSKCFKKQFGVSPKDFLKAKG